MGKVYFTRHGQTIWNVENKICGATDIALTELGHQQAEELGRKILAEGIQIDEILASPLVRAAETARHVSEVTGIPMRIEERLREQNFGRYESTPRNGEEFARAKGNFINSFDGGETMLHLAQRIYNLLDDVKKDEEKDKTPDRFIEEGRMVGLAVDDHSPRQVSRTAVRFPVEVIAPSADGLGEGDDRYEQIEHVERVDALAPADDIDCDHPEDYPTVYGKPAFAYVQHIRETVIVGCVE
jgi:probable phosphoglycerate mutase